MHCSLLKVSLGAEYGGRHEGRPVCAHAPDSALPRSAACQHAPAELLTVHLRHAASSMSQIHWPMHEWDGMCEAWCLGVSTQAEQCARACCKAPNAAALVVSTRLKVLLFGCCADGHLTLGASLRPGLLPSDGPVSSVSALAINTSCTGLCWWPRAVSIAVEQYQIGLRLQATLRSSSLRV